jgi:hypothetical protein
MKQPIRWVQTNPQEIDAAMDPQKFVNEVANVDANALLMAMGGISAFYPSKVPYHYVSPYIPKGHDNFGEVLKLSHARGIRIMAPTPASRQRHCSCRCETLTSRLCTETIFRSTRKDH